MPVVGSKMPQQLCLWLRYPNISQLHCNHPPRTCRHCIRFDGFLVLKLDTPAMRARLYHTRFRHAFLHAHSSSASAAMTTPVTLCPHVTWVTHPIEDIVPKTPNTSHSAMCRYPGRSICTRTKRPRVLAGSVAVDSLAFSVNRRLNTAWAKPCSRLATPNSGGSGTADTMTQKGKRRFVN